MRASEQALKLIAAFESFSATPYICPAGYLTIGYGHVTGPHESFDRIDVIAARRLLTVDMAVAERAVNQLITVALNQSQFDALVSFTFNVGSGALERSTLRRVVNRAEHDAVPAQMLRWVYGGGRMLAGLVRRRSDEGRLYSGIIEPI